MCTGHRNRVTSLKSIFCVVRQKNNFFGEGSVKSFKCNILPVKYSESIIYSAKKGIGEAKANRINNLRKKPEKKLALRITPLLEPLLKRRNPKRRPPG